MKQLLRAAAWLALCSSAACRPETPATEQAKPPEKATPPPDTASAPPTPTRPVPVRAPGSPDTLRLPGGQVGLLLRVSGGAFDKLPFGGLPDLPNDPTSEQLPAGQGRVTRQGLSLLLRPAQGPEVRLASTPDAQFTLQNGEGVKYMYWSSLPAAHQWVVRAWYWESVGTVLVDQRTGRHVELMGAPVASPDGRLVLLTSPGLGGGDQPNMLSLVQVEATGPRLLWQIEPNDWEPVEARWLAPDRVVLKRRHALPDGSMADDAPVSYDLLTLPH
jgi:hypothetical protein